MKNSPYNKVFTLLQPLEHVECWNYYCAAWATIPAGELIEVCHENDATHTTISVKPGHANEGIPVFMPDSAPMMLRDGSGPSMGYRFIVDNQVLGEAIGVTMPKRTADLVGQIINYESGDASPVETERLFKTLRRTGIGRKLQGHYSSRM